MRDRPPTGDIPPENDNANAPQRADDSDKPEGWQPTVADYMRGTSGTDYDDPVWDLSSAEANAELARRAQARVNAAVEREPELRRPHAAEPQIGDVQLAPADQPGAATIDDPDGNAGARLFRRGSDVYDAGNELYQEVDAFRHLPDPPTGHPGVRVQDRPSGPVVSPGQQHMDAGSVATSVMIMVVAANRLKDQIHEWRRHGGD